MPRLRSSAQRSLLEQALPSNTACAADMRFLFRVGPSCRSRMASNFESLHIHKLTRPLNCGNADQGPCLLFGVSDTCRIGGTSWPQIGPSVPVRKR